MLKSSTDGAEVMQDSESPSKTDSCEGKLDACTAAPWSDVTKSGESDVWEMSMHCTWGGGS